MQDLTMKFTFDTILNFLYIYILYSLITDDYLKLW